MSKVNILDKLSDDLNPNEKNNSETEYADYAKLLGKGTTDTGAGLFRLGDYLAKKNPIYDLIQKGLTRYNLSD